MSTPLRRKYRISESDNENVEGNQSIEITISNNKRLVNFKPYTSKERRKLQRIKISDVNIDNISDQSQEMKSIRDNLMYVPKLNQNMKFVSGVYPWYRVIIPYGAKLGKDAILETLLNFISPDTFTPYCYKMHGNAVLFYVDDKYIAEKLFYANNKATMSDGFKLVVIVANISPKTTINADIKEKMKLTMAKRYYHESKSLDLTKFYADPDLSDTLCTLSTPTIMATAINIIADNIPDLEALSLNDNKLRSLKHLKLLSRKLKNLKVLYLGDNMIPFIECLNSLKSLPLVEVYLKGNPFLYKFQEYNFYVSAIRNIFSHLVKLDGVNLPSLNNFYVEKVPLPSHQQSFFMAPSGEDFAREFLTQYFAMYDSDSRHSLLEAYDEQAIMTITAETSSYNRQEAYTLESQDMTPVTEPCTEQQCVGRLQIISFLSELPKTQHDLFGFAVNLALFTPVKVMIAVKGVYKERSSNNSLIRSFHRTFIVVPKSTGGFCITNDTLFVTNATQQQEEEAFSSGTIFAYPTRVDTPTPAVAALTNDQFAMLTLLSQQTGMNQYWSMYYLHSSGWDLQRALVICNQLLLESKIQPGIFN